MVPDDVKETVSETFVEALNIATSTNLSMSSTLGCSCGLQWLRLCARVWLCARGCVPVSAKLFGVRCETRIW